MAGLKALKLATKIIGGRATGPAPKAIALTYKLVAGSSNATASSLAASAQKMILDKKLLYDKVNAANVRNLYKASALVRTIARQSIRRSKKKSAPGQPPHAHRNPGIKLINFAVDKVNENATVGVMRFGGVKGVDVPKHLEYGGPNVVRGKNTQRRKMVAPRPFMHPAEVKARTKYPQFWKDSL